MADAKRQAPVVRCLGFRDAVISDHKGWLVSVAQKALQLSRRSPDCQEQRSSFPRTSSGSIATDRVIQDARQSPSVPGRGESPGKITAPVATSLCATPECAPLPIGHGLILTSFPIPDGLPQKGTRWGSAQLRVSPVAPLSSFTFLRMEPAIISLRLPTNPPVAQLISALGMLKLTHRFFKA